MVLSRTPNDTVYKMISLPRWQREWINGRRGINFSGLSQELITELIRQYDPKYYEKHKGLLQERIMPKKDVIESIIKNHPEIIQNI